MKIEIEQITGKIGKLLEGYRPDGYEISFGSSRNLSIEVKEQKIDTFKCSTPVGVSIRVLKAGGMGFSYSTSLDEGALSMMVENAVTGALNQTPDPLNSFPLPRRFPSVGGLHDEELSSVSEGEKIDRAMELERLVMAADPRIRRVRKSVYGESEYEVWIKNSLGVSGNYRRSYVSCSVSAVAEEGDESQMGWDFGFSNYFSGISVEAVAAKAAAKAVGLLGAKKIPTMRCPVVLDNYVASEILEVLAPSFLAENIRKGKSMLAGRMGEDLFAGVLRIRDDGTMPGGMATAPFDAEGSPQQNTLLVDNGRLTAFLYDTYSARKEGVASTGNVVSGGTKAPPRMGVTNFFIENGSEPITSMIGSIDKGVFLTGVMGMHMADPISGDFSVGATGIYIEKGSLSFPVKGIAIAGNIIDLFRDLEKVGDDIRFFGGVGSPSLKIGALDISGS
jgi:PmbA protein